MNTAREHIMWLSLVETSGPFLSMPVLLQVFPQGLDQRDAAKASRLREAYEDWLERGKSKLAVHHAWIRHVLTELLEYPAEYLAEGQAIPPGMEASMPNYGETLRPDYALKHREAGQKPVLLIKEYPPDQDLEKPVTGKVWKAAPSTRMMELLRVAEVPLGLVTNGEQWMLVYAPRGETTGFATWYADLWMQEPITLRAFHSLLHLRRFLGVAEPETLSGLYAQSSKDQHEVTDQLGYQVRQAVEMLVQAFDRVDAESGRALLDGVNEKTLYDSALTVMMRLVFLFCAEERGLLLLGDPLYDQNYAVSTLSQQLRERADQQGEELLERRHDAWSRLLATFRAVHGGVQHEAMRLPPYGGTLFDPDRFPFLEGRAAGTRWQDAAGRPLAINNRVVLHLLEALQLLRVKVPGGGPAEVQRLSFRALDIEQIGHVYEGLLDHTATRAQDTILGLAGNKNSEPEVAISKLEEVARKGSAALIEFLHEETGRSVAALQRLMDKPPQLDEHAVLIACNQNPQLAARVTPFAALVRNDSFGQLVIIPAGSVYVTAGSDRRSTGTHYTPRSLTEPIVQHTLEPLVYVGPAESTPQAEWRLKSPKEILALKVCDMAMGSGAFLVQACRYLSERLAEAWENAETAANAGTASAQEQRFVITPEGDLSSGAARERLIPADAAERLAIARRYVADRCLYGVDINPMAVEMAKLSLWLITLQRDRPFTFLDHALKCGDSLLGVSTLQQVEQFSLRAGNWDATFGTVNLFRHIDDATAKRTALENLPSNDYMQIEAKNRLYAEAEAATAKLKAIADCLIAFELRGLDGEAYKRERAKASDQVELAMHGTLPEFQSHAREQLHGRRTFHWVIEFPEVFGRGGFDAFVGNPPFLGGVRISTRIGPEYLSALQALWGNNGRSDLCAYFVNRAISLLCEHGAAGLLATNTIAQGDTREISLDRLKANGSTIYRAVSSLRWPGTAVIHAAILWICRFPWSGSITLDGGNVQGITPYLTEISTIEGSPKTLNCNSGYAFSGSYIMGDGFQISPELAQQWIEFDHKYGLVLFPYLRGEDVTTRPDMSPSRWVINFGDMPLAHDDQSPEYDGPVASDFPLCIKIVEEKVKGERLRKSADVASYPWWQFWRRRNDLYARIRSLSRVLFHPFTSKYMNFVYVPTNYIYGAPHVIIAMDTDDAFAVLQSHFHEVWAWRYCSTMKSDLRYASSDIFSTFPFPDKSKLLVEFGRRYDEYRRGLMLARHQGLTKTYNRFHDKDESSTDIVNLRVLHSEIDHAVAVAYGWGDLDLGHGFHETKQGVRYTISEPARRIVLDRLLALNHQRYEEEVKAGLHDKGAKKGKAQKSRALSSPDKSAPQPTLFE